MSEQAAFESIPAFQRMMREDTGLESHDGREDELMTFMREKTATLPRPVPVAKLLALMDEFSYNTAFLISIGYDKAKIVRDLIREKKPKTFVELGGYLGYSALLVADAMKEYAPDAKVWSVELDSGCADKAEEFVRLAGLEKNIEFVRATGVDAVEKMQSKGLFKGVDMLFLDHVEDLYMQDFKFYLEKGVVGTGATVFADNVVRPGAPEYRKYVRGLKGVESKGVKGMITPGMFEDEFEVTEILNADEARQ